jgi:MFS family permease
VAATVAVSACYMTVMALSALPAPLYPEYRRRNDLSLSSLSGVFSAYMVGVAVALFVGAGLSDRYGRRRMILCGCATALVAAGVFATVSDLVGLLLARFLTGVAVALVSAASTAQLLDLWPPRPGRPRPVGETVGTAANLGGIGVGALLGSLALEVSARPLSSPYLTYVLVLVVAGSAAAVAADGPRRRPRAASGASPPPSTRERVQEFRAACLGAFVVLATLGFFSSLTPVFLDSQHGAASGILIGLVIASPFLVSAVVQIGVAKVDGVPSVLGLLLIPAGLGLAAMSMGSSQPRVFLLGSVVSGAGCGLVFRRALHRVALLSGESERGAVTSAFLLVGYLGPIVPVMALGLVSDLVAPLRAVTLFAVVIGLCCVLILADLHRRRPCRDLNPSRQSQHVKTRGTS